MRSSVSPDETSEAAPKLRDVVGIGGVAVGSIVVGILVGFWLDDVLDTEPILTLCGLGFGIASAGYLSWRRISPFLHSNGPAASWGPETYDDDDDDN